MRFEYHFFIGIVLDNTKMTSPAELRNIKASGIIVTAYLSLMPKPKNLKIALAKKDGSVLNLFDRKNTPFGKFLSRVNNGKLIVNDPEIASILVGSDAAGYFYMVREKNGYLTEQTKLSFQELLDYKSDQVMIICRAIRKE